MFWKRPSRVERCYEWTAVSLTRFEAWEGGKRLPSPRGRSSAVGYRLEMDQARHSEIERECQAMRDEFVVEMGQVR